MDLVLTWIRRKWKYLKCRINLSLQEFLDGVIFLMSSTYFKFDGKYFKQTHGAPMDGCSSPWFGELALECLELHCLNVLKNSVVFYKRYVDDCLLIIKENDIDRCLCEFNDFNEHLKFTMENKENKSINFLEMSLIRKGNKIISNWYRKSTYSGNFVHFDSHHPLSQKRAIVYGLVDKAINLYIVDFMYKI